MNILHVESSLNWGGQEQRTLQEARWLNENGHRAWIACNPASELRRRGGDLCIPVTMRGSFDPAASTRLATLCRQRAIDVVHAHSPKDAWICSALHFAGQPVVRSRQITNPVKTKWSRSVIYRRGCARVIASAACIRQDLIARNGVDPDRIDVVGEGVDLARFHPEVNGAALRTAFGVGPDNVLFGLVAMIRPEKGHLFFVDAARQVLQNRPEARFAIVGEGTGRREYETTVRERLQELYGDERSGPIFMTGYRTDAPNVMAALDVLVVPSEAEAQSLVVPQAFATRRAVIASKVGGLPELVRDGETGLLVAPGDAVALAGAAKRLCADPALRARLATAGYRFALQNLSLQQKMEESLAIYADVAATAPRRSFRRPKKPLPDNVVPFALTPSRPFLKTAVRAAGIAAALLIGWFNLGAAWNPFPSAPRLLPDATQQRADIQAHVGTLGNHERLARLDDYDEADDLLMPDDDDLA